MTVGWRSVFATWAVAAWAPLAGAEVFEGERGFAISYPDEWALAYEQRAPQRLAGPARLWDVLFYDASGDLCCESVMVAEVEQAVEGGPEGAARVRDELLAAARGARTDVRIVAEGVERFAGRDCPSVHYVAKRYDVPSPSRHWRVVIPAGPRSYYVTCNACLGTFDAHEATFRGMLEAARAPAPGGQVPHAAVTLTALALLGVAALVTRMIVRAAGLR